MKTFYFLRWQSPLLPTILTDYLTPPGTPIFFFIKMTAKDVLLLPRWLRSLSFLVMGQHEKNLEGVITELTIVLPRKGVVTNYLAYFYLSPLNQKESDLSHLGDLPDILHGHFDAKK